MGTYLHIFSHVQDHQATLASYQLPPNGETLELKGTINEFYNDPFVVQNTAIWHDISTAFKYESGFSLEVGQSVQVEANPMWMGQEPQLKYKLVLYSFTVIEISVYIKSVYVS